jgi:peptide/nickel transport system substrate-binding protein
MHPIRRGVLAAASAAACALISGFAPAAVQAAELKIAQSTDPSSLDPHFAAVAGNLAVSAHFFDALVNVDPAGRYVPGLAVSWTALDATTWEFKLRPGVKFHDGAELTAEDVAFSLERPAKVVNSPGPFTSYTKMIASMQVVNPLTLRIRTTEPYAPLPGDLASVYIVSKKAAANASNEDFNAGRALVGTGPFTLGAFKRGDSLTMNRHAAYWGEKSPWDKVTLRFITADPARVAALLSGDVDIIESVPPADMPRLKADSRFSLKQRPTWRTLFLQLNHGAVPKSPWFTDKAGQPLEQNPLKDIRVREALSKGLNRQGLVQVALDGFATPAAQIIGIGLVGFNPNLRGADGYDPEGAKKLLAEAGYPNGFTITLAAPNNRYINDEQVAQAVAQLWSRIGVQAKVVTMPMSTYVPKMRNGDFGAALLGWGTMGADFGLRTLLGSIDPAKGWGGWNWGKYSNPKLDELIHAALTAPDTARRHDAAQVAMAAAMKDYAALPTHYQLATWAMRPGLNYVGRIDEFTFAHQVKPAE